MSRTVMRLRGVLLGVTVLLSLAAPQLVSGQMRSPGGSPPGDAIFDHLNDSTTQPLPRVPSPTVPSPLESWVPDRYVQTPRGDNPVLVPGYWERRLSDHEVYTPPLLGTTPNGDVINFPAGVRPPVNKRQAP
jgi:hypothetical protein